MAPAFAHRFVEHVLAGGSAELADVTEPEATDRLGCELEFAHLHQVEGPELPSGALAFRVEAADRFERVAEKVEPHRQGRAAGVEIYDRAAHRIFAGIAHGRGAGEPVKLEPADHPFHLKHVAR